MVVVLAVDFCVVVIDAVERAVTTVNEYVDIQNSKGQHTTDRTIIMKLDDLQETIVSWEEAEDRGQIVDNNYVSSFEDIESFQMCVCR